MIALRDRQAGPASLHSAPKAQDKPQKSPKPRLELGEADPFSCVLANLGIAVGIRPSPQPMLNLATWTGFAGMLIRLQSARQVLEHSIGHSWIHQISLPARPARYAASPPTTGPARCSATLARLAPDMPNAPTVKLFRLSASWKPHRVGSWYAKRSNDADFLLHRPRLT